MKHSILVLLTLVVTACEMPTEPIHNPPSTPVTPPTQSSTQRVWRFDINVNSGGYRAASCQASGNLTLSLTGTTSSATARGGTWCTRDSTFINDPDHKRTVSQVSIASSGSSFNIQLYAAFFIVAGEALDCFLVTRDDMSIAKTTKGTVQCTHTVNSILGEFKEVLDGTWTGTAG